MRLSITMQFSLLEMNKSVGNKDSTRIYTYITTKSLGRGDHFRSPLLILVLGSNVHHIVSLPEKLCVHMRCTGGSRG